MVILVPWGEIPHQEGQSNGLREEFLEQACNPCSPTTNYSYSFTDDLPFNCLGRPPPWSQGYNFHHIEIICQFHWHISIVPHKNYGVMDSQDGSPWGWFFRTPGVSSGYPGGFTSGGGPLKVLLWFSWWWTPMAVVPSTCRQVYLDPW